MNRKQIGQIGMMASALILSLEMFSLKILQSLDKTSAWSYLTCPTSLLTLLLILIVFVVSLVLYLNGKENL